MALKFHSIEPEQITDNTFKLIGSDWMLITAGKIKSYNMMTASWGGFGVLWHKHVCWCVIRPQRHTYTLMEKSNYFTLSFFHEEHRNLLQFFGSHSGKHVNKMGQAGITPRETDHQNIYFDEARLVIECKKIYFQDITPANFLDPKTAENYPNKDYHRMYVGEIISCLIK
ncbi:MAG: flavin reductase [bacterium]